jgi:nicotinamide-nucleotide amidase
MKVEIISIGTALLVSDILDTNAAYISRALRELNADLLYKVTVGDNLDHITEALRIALGRADVVFTTGGLGPDRENFTQQAAASATQLPIDQETNQIVGSQTLEQDLDGVSGFMVDGLPGLLICLPGNRREMAYLLETEVLPLLRARANLQSEWLILRTVGVMESSLRQQLADLALEGNQRISFDSYAGQTNLLLRVQAATPEARQQQMAQLRLAVAARLGDQVFGEGADRLENVILQMLARGQFRLAVAECGTGHFLSRLLVGQLGVNPIVTLLPGATPTEISAALGLEAMESEEGLVNWQRQAAEALRRTTAVPLALLIYNTTTPGGVQVSVVLASDRGVSVTQRSFSGHPHNIEQWACNLGLSHLHRWLLAHGTVAAGQFQATGHQPPVTSNQQP